MKINHTTAICLLFFSVAIAAAPPSAAAPARLVIETLEQLSKAAGRAPAKGTLQALEAAYAKEGTMALKAARLGGLNLPEAAARHGQEVFAYACRVPEAAPALASRAGELLPLARRYGDDFLHLEARIPGLGDDAARLFPAKNQLRRLNALPPEQARKVVSYASHAVDPNAPELLLAAVEKQGVGLLAKLDSRKILALGFSSAMVIAAGGGAVAIGSTGDGFVGFLETAVMPVSIAVALVILLLGCVLALRLKSWLSKRGNIRP